MTGTLVRATFSMTRLPAVAGLDEVVHTDLIPMGVLVMELSSRVTEPTFWLLEPPAVMSMPTPQLLMERPEYVQPQSQSWMMAVWQLLKTRFLMVYCWFPTEAPVAPPLKVRSVRNPALPSSMNKPTWTTSELVGMTNWIFCRLVAWAGTISVSDD